MTIDAAEAAFREAVGREGSLGRLGRALALSDRASFHLLEVLTPRTLRAAVPPLAAAVGSKGVAQVRVTLDEMSSRDGLTTAVFAALAAEATAATPLLIDASAALPSETDAWTWCLDRWNERRDRIAAERTAPVVLAAPSWLVVLLAESAPDLWSVRGPSARVDVAPPPAIAMIDRVSMAFVVSIGNWQQDRPPAEDVHEALSLLNQGMTGSRDEVRRAALLLLHEAEERQRAWDIGGALQMRLLATLWLGRLLAETPDDELLRVVHVLALVSLGGLQWERETLDTALASYLNASSLLDGIRFSNEALSASVGIGVTAGLAACHTQLLLGDTEGVRRRLLSGDAFLQNVLPRLSPREILSVSHLTLLMRVAVLTSDYPAATEASLLVGPILAPGVEPLARGFALPAVAEFHLDRGDNDRVRSLSHDALKTAMSARLLVGTARCALGASDPQTALDLLCKAKEAPNFGTGSPASQSPGGSTETYVLGTEVARALGDVALTQQYVALAEAALADLQQRDPMSPRCARLVARFAEQRVAPVQS